MFYWSCSWSVWVLVLDNGVFAFVGLGLWIMVLVFINMGLGLGLVLSRSLVPSCSGSCIVSRGPCLV